MIDVNASVWHDATGQRGLTITCPHGTATVPVSSPDPVAVGACLPVAVEQHGQRTGCDCGRHLLPHDRACCSVLAHDGIAIASPLPVGSQVN